MTRGMPLAQSSLAIEADRLFTCDCLRRAHAKVGAGEESFENRSRRWQLAMLVNAQQEYL